ncbi:MAG: twin-arginine translocation signal domain-containing protein, partial [Planctomycetota bacterium]
MNQPPRSTAAVTRRDVLARSGLGLGWLGAASLLADEASADGGVPSTLAPRPPRFPARARAVIHIFANG